METQETILIFQEPQLYFFPHYKNITFKPYDISERSLSYFIYKLLYICHIPLYSYFWGTWKKHIPSAKQVIIFDYGYQRGMEQYIHKTNPNCKVFLFMWNKVDAAHKNHTIFTDKDAIYSTDPGDCRIYNLKYNHIFYPMEYRMGYTDAHKHRLFFLGADKNRGSAIKQLKRLLEQCNLDCDIRILSQSKNTAYLAEVAELITSTCLSYTQYMDEVKHCGILLDIVQQGQQALTMRVLESIFLSKKLITNNMDIKNYDFYNPNNILLLPKLWDDNLIPVIRDFINKPFIPYSDDILRKYDFHHWLSNFDS